MQDEIFVSDFVRLNIGARVDKFDVIDEPVFSPRVALILKPTADQAIRLSYNKAFRSPSLINNYLDVTIINQLAFAQLASINPLFSQLGTFNFPVVATGNESLKEESIEGSSSATQGSSTIARPSRRPCTLPRTPTRSSSRRSGGIAR